MRSNKLQILHCNCGAIYLTESRKLEGKSTCPECGRIPKTEQLQLPSVSAKAVPRRIFLAAVTVTTVLGIIAFLPKSQPQQVQPSTAPVTVKSALEPSSKPIQSSPKPTPSRSPVSLPNGTNIIPPQDSQGRGKLKIVNGTTHDAAVKLIDSVSGKTRRFVYVQANHEATLKSINPCSCILKFSLGTDWDRTTQKFLQNRSFKQFSNPLDFKETKKEAGVEWMDYEITLHPVPHGSARTTSIDESDF